MRAPQPRGFAGTADSIVSAGSATAGAFSGQIAGGTGLTALTGASVAIPIIGLAIAGVTIAIMAYLHRRGPVQKVQTTHIVNDAEPFLAQNVAVYLGGPRTLANQQAAEANFHTLWDRVVAECSQPQFGDPGGRCVTDRQRGSTKGYDWWALYLDPIQNDSTVVADQSASFMDPFTGTAGSAGGGMNLMLLIGAALLAAAMVIK